MWYLIFIIIGIPLITRQIYYLLIYLKDICIFCLVNYLFI